MHSALNRAQAVFGFFTTVALFVAGFAALSVLVFPTDNVTADVQLKDVKVYAVSLLICYGLVNLVYCANLRVLHGVELRADLTTTQPRKKSTPRSGLIWMPVRLVYNKVAITIAELI